MRRTSVCGTFHNAIHEPYRVGLLNRRLGILFLLLFFCFVPRRRRAPSGVRFLCRRTGGDAFRRCRKARLGKSFVKIKRQNVVPVGRYAEIGIRLPRSRADNVEKFGFLESMIPLDRERGDARLLSFLNHEADKQIALFALVVVFSLLFDLGIEKPVRLDKECASIARRNPPAFG